MILSDRDLEKLINKKELIIDPFFKKFLGPNCYYCHLGYKFLRLSSKKKIISPSDKNTLKNFYKKYSPEKEIIIEPKEFLLAETFEYIGISDKYTIQLLNSSSLARIGISQAALGFINAGCGSINPIKITLELINNTNNYIKLRPTIIKKGFVYWGTEILKIVVVPLSSKPKKPYNEWKFKLYENTEVMGCLMYNREKINNKDVLPKESRYYYEQRN
ncbi:MAG: dCTP deaminase [Candidatus Aenigmarchaeota archaeon ex4484_56]|nr:MAG: dCTP deaminase [Candidatus Aenigmarchaeota archaeon ex4484_56]